MKKWLAIKNNYVVDCFVWDGIGNVPYKAEGVEIIEDVDQNVMIGAYYERVENIFYFPIGKTPPDFPT